MTHLDIEDAFWAAFNSMVADEAEALGPGYYEYEFMHDEIVITFHPYKEGAGGRSFGYGVRLRGERG